jgi:hypothetical protein
MAVIVENAVPSSAACPSRRRTAVAVRPADANAATPAAIATRKKCPRPEIATLAAPNCSSTAPGRSAEAASSASGPGRCRSMAG